MKRATVGLFLAIAVVAGCANPPVNPPVQTEPAWPNEEVEALARRACFDCHSNETKWPVYTTWPIVGQLVVGDVLEGRDELNFSEWDRAKDELDDLGEVVREGEMPLGIYVAAHPDAKLTDAERATLAAGLEQLTGISGGADNDDDSR